MSYIWLILFGKNREKAIEVIVTRECQKQLPVKEYPLGTVKCVGVYLTPLPAAASGTLVSSEMLRMRGKRCQH